MRLDVGKVIVGAFLVPWSQRREFARALAFPLVALAVLTLGWYFTAEKLPQWIMWPACLAYGILFAIFAVACHRLVLLDPRRVHPGWSWREVRFLFWLVGMYLVYLAVWLPVWTVLVNLTPGMSPDWTREPAVIPALYFVARLSLVLPAVALDGEVSFKWAWRLTRGNGWRLVVVVGVLPWAISQVLGLLYRADPTPVETVALTVIGIALFAVEIAALSISYRDLTTGHIT